MKRLISNSFLVLGAFSFLCLVLGGITLVMGAIMQFSTPAQADHVQHIGTVTANVGLVGLPLFGWLYTGFQDGKAVALLTVLRRAARHDQSKTVRSGSISPHRF